MLKDTIVNCLNCEKPLKKGFKFCPNCGQKTNEVLTVGVLFYNTVANYFSFDARFFKSFFPLLFKPGMLAKYFVNGKRLLYLHPAQMYLFVSVLFFFLFSFGVRKQAQSLDESLAKTIKKSQLVPTMTNTHIKDSISFSEIDTSKKKDSISIDVLRKVLRANAKSTGLNDKPIDSVLAKNELKGDKDDIFKGAFGFNEDTIDSLILSGASDAEIYKNMGVENNVGAFKRRLYKQGLKFYRNRKGGSFLQSFYDTIPIAMFFLLPIFAFILKVFYFNGGRYAHHLVFSFYYFSFLFTAFSMIVGVNMIWDIPNWVDWLAAISTFLYFFMALKRFYGQSWFLTFVKANLATFTFLLFVTPITVMILGLFTFLFY